ncbi:MAG TPA: alpha/beta hydrolase [Candidatus Binataceae bacterium]|nr:alpha/beta hydrolase [Candidatus Binataceae bacterium]
MGSSQFVNLNGLKLHYLDYGNSDKPPLICIHGLSGNAHNFDALAPHLASDYHVLSVDVRGRGDSQWGPGGDYNATTYASDLASLIDTLKFDRVTLIGTSMGGMISMLYAGGYPERVARMVLNDVGPEVDPSGIKRITDYMTTSPAEFANLAEVAAYYRENYPALRTMAEAPLQEFVKWAVKPGPDGRLVWKLDPAIRNAPRTGSAARRLDMWVPYARISARILVVRGADSDILARATADRMRVVLPEQTAVVEVPGVGHAPSLLEPEALTAIKQFLGL